MFHQRLLRWASLARNWRKVAITSVFAALLVTTVHFYLNVEDDTLK
jgi:hypothetical protein